MPDYAAQVTPADRWAIVAYIKALQLSQKATQADVPAGEHVQPLSSIAEHEGLPASFADEWALPPTAVTGTLTTAYLFFRYQELPERGPLPRHIPTQLLRRSPAGQTVPKQ